MPHSYLILGSNFLMQKRVRLVERSKWRMFRTRFAERFERRRSVHKPPFTQRTGEYAAGGAVRLSRVCTPEQQTYFCSNPNGECFCKTEFVFQKICMEDSVRRMISLLKGEWNVQWRTGEYCVHEWSGQPEERESEFNRWLENRSRIWTLFCSVVPFLCTV